MSVGVATRTVRVGLIGAGIELSLSPALHMEEGRRQGLDYSYELIDLAAISGGVDALPRLIGEAEERGFAGLNITHPCKQVVISYLDELSDDARTLGAVNTVVLKGGKRVGHNTDWSGFAEGFRRGLPGAGLDRVVVSGDGGGAAVGHAAMTLGCQSIVVFDLLAERAEGLARQLQRNFPDRRATVGRDLAVAMATADGVIHASPTGMASHPGLPIPVHLIRGDHWVADIVYFPLETALIGAARARGCRVLDGGNMAVFQACGAFQLFSGVGPDRERMLRHFAEMAGA
jgi:shikimate dehydrogenase